MAAARTVEGKSVFILSLVHLSFGLGNHRRQAVLTDFEYCISGSHDCDEGVRRSKM